MLLKFMQFYNIKVQNFMRYKAEEIQHANETKQNFLKLDVGDNVESRKELHVHKYSVSEKELSSLKIPPPDCSRTDDFWLTDYVIMAFISIVSKEARKNGHSIIPIDSIITYQLINENSLTNGLHNGLIKNKVDIFKFWLLPVLMDNNHWVLFFIDHVKKVVVFINSNSQWRGNKNCLRLSRFKKHHVIEKILEFADIYGLDSKNKSSMTWKVYAPPDIIQQNDGYNCGVHVCLWAYVICHTAPIMFSNGDMTAARHAIKRTLIENHNTDCDDLKSFFDEEEVVEKDQEKLKIVQQNKYRNDEAVQIFITRPQGWDTTIAYLGKVLLM
ncbi:hypothetical protein KQX54_015128 [Cotesia glomerata]|uniref:Ubiquitin-like protease family profile domain-containing protein n=1 Tax=Cotesia glomerata TaxID=32391 RepID=A0AAV7I606_COTGL|nr:hypothetical protein KQX54_015128 [Cotesia glomerata]